MQFTTVVAATVMALLPGSLAAMGQAIVRNACPHNVCVYTTQNMQPYSVTGTFNLTQGQSKAVAYPMPGPGAQVRVSPTCDLANVVYWEFSTDSTYNNVYYDVNINGPASDPFYNLGLSVTGTSSTCKKITCPAGGSTSCFNYPNGHYQNVQGACQDTNTIYFNACNPGA